MIDPDRLVRLMDQRGLSQSRLAQEVGVSSSMVGKLARGEARGSTHLFKIAKALKTSPDYLIGETDDPEEGAFVPPSEEDIALQMGLIKIEEVDLALGMGAAFLDDQTVQSATRWIPEDWVRNFTDSPAALLTVAKPVGDSMYPTINDRDIVLIDRSKHVIDRQDAIWALVYGGLGTIKRVRAMPDGSLKLMGDNPQVREETAYDGEVFVMGRVAGVFRRT